ncbi:MAG: CoB--CoM heterodisulfide reductase iron-sulfur subunit B family protein [Candidatus Omnitrophica bacterium]|nr:CoB--CoM heterodisulfide reductase iron-sulfur subunit B family protein [Candidatus Omnitrophota bacterium]
MRYLYYPGCSLKGTGRAYEESILAVFKKLEIPMDEIEDWNCCGATAYMAVDEQKAYAVASRNLALAERQMDSEEIHVIAPCAACYLVLLKAQHYLESKDGQGKEIRHALKVGGLKYQGKVKIRHPLDVLVNDYGVDKIKEKVERPLEGVRVASYYGCQIVRPYAEFDNQYNPISMDRVMTALGAEAVEWPLKTRCCGGTLTGVVPEVGQRLSYILLREAKSRGADAIVTACPLCQFNLECYQDEMNKRFMHPVDIPPVYFTQMMGVALGLGERELGLQRQFVPLEPALAAK